MKFKFYTFKNVLYFIEIEQAFLNNDANLKVLYQEDWINFQKLLKTVKKAIGSERKIRTQQLRKLSHNIKLGKKSKTAFKEFRQWLKKSHMKWIV